AVADQPWDVAADVLVVPLLGEPMFDGPLGELDRRSGGELRALASFGEITAKRYSTTLGAGGELPISRLLTVVVGDPDRLDREAVVHAAAASERRLAGRSVRRLAVWLDPLASAIEGGAPAAAELVTRGIVEGSYDPATIYRTNVETRPPILDELILIASGEGTDRIGLERAANRGSIVGEGANEARTMSNRSANDVSPQVLAEYAQTVAERHGLSVDVIGPEKAAELGMGMFL